MLNIVTLLLIVPKLIFVGYTFQSLWTWHIATSFNVPEVSLTTSIIIALMVSWMSYQYHTSPNSWERLLSTWVTTGSVLLIGWVLS